MMKFLRSQSQTVLIVILGVLGLSFLFYGNVGSLLTNGATHLGNDFGRIDGQDLSQAELINAVRETLDSVRLAGRADQLAQPGARAQVAEEAWRQMLLLREADRLHIDISDQQVISFIQSQAPFQKDGKYSPDLYQAAMTNLQNNLKITPDRYEEFVRNTLRLEAVSTALFGSVRAPAFDVSADYDKLFGPAEVSYVLLDPRTTTAATPPTEAEIEAAYKEHPDNPAYRTAEKRKVDYVLFPLPADQAKLTGPDKDAAIEALGEKAQDFALALQPEPADTANGSTTTPPPDFATEAKQRGLTPLTTDFFAADQPPAGLPPSPAFNNAAFDLTKDDPSSRAVRLDNGVAVLHLAAIQPSDLRPLNEVSAAIAKDLQQAKNAQALQETAASDAKVLQISMSSGSDFKTAAAGLKLPVQTLSGFIPANASKDDPHLEAIGYAASTLDVGQVSEPMPLQGDGDMLIVHVDSRGHADPAGLTAFESRYRTQEDEQYRSVVYHDWSDWRSRQPGTHVPPNLDEYGAVE